MLKGRRRPLLATGQGRWTTPLHITGFYAGDELAFQLLVTSESQRLLERAASIVKSSDTASDIVQDTWETVYTKRQQFRGNGSIRAWIDAILRNHVHMYLRKEKRQKSHAETFSKELELEINTSCEIAVSDEERQFINTQKHNIVLSAIVSLPTRERKAIVRKMLAGQSIKFIAFAMDCKQGTVKATLSHARQHLQNKLRDLYP